MLISYKNNLKKVAFLTFFVSESLLASPLTLSKSNSYLYKQYMKVHEKFSKELCPVGTEEKFNQLDKDFRALGNYVPVLSDNKLDKGTIREHMPLLAKKIKWIKANISRLKQRKNFGPELKKIKKFRKQIDELLKYKKQYFEKEQLVDRTIAKDKSKKLYAKFKDDFLSFFYRRDYLLGFEYPVNHLKWRRQYDLNKASTNPKKIKKANSTYFYRKIVEDGAQDPNHTRSDIFLRSNLNTMILKLIRPSEIISENIRYDLEDILDSLEYHLKRGVTVSINRNKEWLERVEHSQKFYRDLLKNKVKVGNKIETEKEILRHRSQALAALRSFVLDKQAQSYEFWMKQDPLLRKIFTIETILFNEVGRVDVEGALERKDVTQVVINRSKLDKYSQFDKSDALYHLLKKEKKYKDNQLNNYPWLNVLLKEGEFSFTYYFIPGSIRLFCADMTHIGKKLRDENIYIALNQLKNPNDEFDALRYFSRASMLGRIDMARLWKNYWALLERPGEQVKNSSYLLKKIKRNEYQYFYNFRSADQRIYQVIEIGKKVYSYWPKRKKIYHYRNPHFFTYFSPVSD